MAHGIDYTGFLDQRPEPEEFEPSDEDVEIVAKIKEKLHSARDRRAAVNRMWELCIRYLKGDQLIYRDRDTGQFVNVVDYAPKRMYSINNKLKQTSRALVGKLTRVIPTFNAVPAAGDQSEVQGALAADTILRWFRLAMKMDSKYVRVQRQLQWAGLGIWWLRWNKLKGRRVATCTVCDEFMSFDLDGLEEGQRCPHCIAQAEQQMAMLEQASQMNEQLVAAGEQPEPIPEQAQPVVGNVIFHREGGAEVKVLDPRSVFVPPDSFDFDEIPWTIVNEVLPIQDICQTFPKFAPFLQPESNLYDEEVGRISYNTMTGSFNNDVLSDHARLITYMERPSEMYPNGRMIWICNDMVLGEAEKPYFHNFDRLPLFYNYWERVDGEFYPESFISQAWSRQKELNEASTQVREASELLTRTKVIVPMNTGISADEITASSSQVLKPNPAFAHLIKYLNPPPIPQDLFQREAQLAADIREIASVTDQEVGQSTGASGRADAILNAEADQQIKSILVPNYEEYKQLHLCALKMLRAYMPPDLLCSVVGDDGTLQTVMFRDLQLLTEGFDICLEADDGFSQNQQVRIQQNMELANLGLYNDDRTGMLDKARFARASRLRMDGLGPTATSTEVAAAQALLTRAKNGEYDKIIPQPEDDPTVFSNVLLKWLRTVGRGPDTNPELVNFIREMYGYYTIRAAGGMAVMPQQGGGASPAGSQMTAPGGSVNSLDNQADTSTVATNANNTIQQADNAGSVAAKQGARQEN